jgi:transposase-like protein
MMVMTKSNMSNRYAPEVRARAVRMVFEHQGSYETQAGASIAPRIGCISQTLREWVKQAEKASGLRDGVTTEERDRIKVLEQENRGLRQANEILRKGEAIVAPLMGWMAPAPGIAMCQNERHRDVPDERSHPWNSLSPSASILPRRCFRCMALMRTARRP